MRILVLGNNYSSRSFYNLFKKNKENIVFSSQDEMLNQTDLSNYQDIADFCEANEINLVLIADEKYIIQNLIDKLDEKNITTFSPSQEASEITVSKAYAKRFAHKNKIPTPRFQIAERSQIALDYIKTATTAQAIKPDVSSFQECTLFCETNSQAQKIINDFFTKGNKKIVIEDYIEGKNITAWTLSDGYSAKIIATVAKYQNVLSLFEPDFVSEEIKEKIFDMIILPTLNGLNLQNSEYIGILGFNIILDYAQNPYLINYYNFFDDLSVDFFTQGYLADWQDIFESTVVGDVFQKYELETVNKSMLTIIQNNEINFIEANTKTNLYRYLKNMDFDLTLFNEAKKIWKF